MNCPHYTPGYLSLSRANLSWQKNNFQSFPHISSLSTPALLKNWGIVFLAVAPRPAFSSNHTPQSVGRKLATLRERTVRIREVRGFDPLRVHQVAASCISLAATFFEKSPARSFRCVSFSEKGHAAPLLLACKRAPAYCQPYSLRLEYQWVF